MFCFQRRARGEISLRLAPALGHRLAIRQQSRARLHRARAARAAQGSAQAEVGEMRGRTVVNSRLLSIDDALVIWRGPSSFRWNLNMLQGL